MARLSLLWDIAGTNGNDAFIDNFMHDGCVVADDRLSGKKL
jgi:hypothetical protein